MFIGIVFSNNRTRAAELTEILESASFPTEFIAGDMSQPERIRVFTAIRDYQVE